MEQSGSRGSIDEAIRLMKAGQVDDAISILGDLCHRDSDNAQVHMYLGIAYGQKNDKLHAIHHLETSCNLEDNARACYNLAVIYETAHRIDEAVRQYRAAVELDPGYALAREAIERLHSQFEATHPPAAPESDSAASEEPAGPERESQN